MAAVRNDAFREIQHFAKQCAATGTIPSLTSSIEGAIRDFGFRWFALAQPVDTKVKREQALLLTNYPSSWIEESFENNLYIDDPVHMAVQRTYNGLTWDEIGRYIRPSIRQINTLSKAAKHGLQSGFSIPLRMIGEPGAVFTVAQRSTKPFRETSLLAMHLIGSIAYGRARSIFSPTRTDQPVTLTVRQIECVGLAAQGMSDFEIARALHISPETVREHFVAARRRYGVARRSQLLLHAARDGYINLAALPSG